MSGRRTTQPVVESVAPQLVLERSAAADELGRFVRDAGVSLTHVLVAACGRAIAAEPAASVGLAFATERGPVAPVVRGADRPLPEVFAEVDRLIAAARDGRLVADDFGDRAITVSLNGSGRAGSAAGPPDGFLLDVREAVGGAPELSLAVDCRPLDSARAELLLANLVRLLEHPYRRLV